MTTPTPARRRVRWIVLGGGVVLALALLDLAWAAWLAVTTDEGAVPPGWRDPEVPAGARVMSETEPCASGGCWREVLLEPAEGQTAEQLAAAMGLTDERYLGWHVLDPHDVVLGSEVVDDGLRVYVRYGGRPQRQPSTPAPAQ